MKEREEQYNNEFTSNWDSFTKTGRRYIGSVSVLEDGRISCQARVLFQIISSLSVKEGYCYALNATLSERLGKGETMVKKYLNELEKAQMITTVYTENGIKRRIFLNFEKLIQRYAEDSSDTKMGQKASAKWVTKQQMASRKQMITKDEVVKLINKKGGK